jgi:hypothetical protein
MGLSLCFLFSIFLPIRQSRGGTSCLLFFSVFFVDLKINVCFLYKKREGEGVYTLGLILQTVLKKYKIAQHFTIS